MNRLFPLLLLLLSVIQSWAQPAGSGYALELNGNKYVSLNSPFSNLSLPVTVCAWIKPNNGSSPQRIFFSHTSVSAYYGVSFQIINGGLNLAFGNGNATNTASRRTGSAGISLQANRWYHVAGVIQSNGTIDLYLNGVALSVSYSGWASPPMGVDNSTGLIGRANNNTSNYSNADFDELSFWSKALTANEIRDLMCRKLTGNESNLLAYYRFDDGAGNTLSNRVTGGPNGTSSNNPVWAISSAPVGDRSFHNYYNNLGAIGFSTSGDSIIADPSNAGSMGTQLYVVDDLPASTAGITVPPGVDYYFGVFNVDYNKSYDVKVFPGPVNAAANPGSLKLAERVHNATTPWSLTTSTNNPNFDLSGRNGPGQFMIASDPCSDFNLGNDTSVCAGAGFKIGRPKGPNETYTWSTGASTDSISITTSGSYHLKVSHVSGCYEEDTIVITILQPFSDYLPADTMVCDSFFMELQGPLYNFNWNNGQSLTDTFVSMSSGPVWFTARDSATGCTLSDTMNLTVLNSTSLPSISIDTTLCNLYDYTVDASSNAAVSYQWFDGNTSPIRNFSQSGSYPITTTYPGGCTTSDTVVLKFSEFHTALLQDEFSICNDDTLELEVSGGPFQAIIWSDGSNNQQAHYWLPGIYWVETQNMDGCWQRDSFEVYIASPIDSVQVFNDTSFCAGRGIVLSPPEGFRVKWPDGSGGDFFVGRTQDVRIEVADGCSNSIQFFKVSEYSCECDVKFPTAFTPNGDGLNDVFGPATICEFTSFRLQVFNRFGGIIFSSNSAEKLFEGTFKGQPLPVGVYTYIFNYSTPHKSGTRRGYFSLIR